MTRLCKQCKTPLSRKRYNGRLEDLARFNQRQHCSRTCGNTKVSRTRDGYNYHARKMRKAACESCGSTQRLCAHHIDRDWTNNNPLNIQTLCSSCHTSEHHRAGDILTVKQKPQCLHCDKISYRQELCSTHLTRLKRYGNPLLTRKKYGSQWLLVTAATGRIFQSVE